MNHTALQRQSMVAAALLLALTAALAQPIPTVVVAQAAQAGGFSLEGVVQAVNQTTLSAQTGGRLLSLKVKAGDPVKAGQVIATIDDREAAVGNERSQAQMLQAQAEYRNAQIQYERARDLAQKGFVSKAALDTASTQLQSAQAGKEQAAASMKISGITQGYARVTAPYDGWVLQTHLQAGDLAVPGAPLVTVYAPQPLRAVVQVPGTRGAQARAATHTTIEIENAAPGSERIEPLSRQIIPSADPVSQTSEWRWDLPAKQTAGLVPGQPLRVQFEGVAQAGGAAIMIPVQAIVRRGELTGVYVAQGKGFLLRAVRTGAQRSGDRQEIIAGLRSGDVVALDPVKAAAAR